MKISRGQKFQANDHSISQQTPSTIQMKPLKRRSRKAIQTIKPPVHSARFDLKNIQEPSFEFDCEEAFSAQQFLIPPRKQDALIAERIDLLIYQRDISAKASCAKRPLFLQKQPRLYPRPQNPRCEKQRPHTRRPN